MNHSSSDGATSPPQAVDDAEVRRAIQEGLAAGREMFPDDPGQAATHAWHHVLEQRQHAQLDVNLAAAEHYLYARSMGIDEGALNGIATTVLAMGYDAIKKAAFAVGMEEHLAADDGAISEPTWESTVWGVKGGIDGLTGDEPEPPPAPEPPPDEGGPGFADPLAGIRSGLDRLRRNLG